MLRLKSFLCKLRRLVEGLACIAEPIYYILGVAYFLVFFAIHAGLVG